MCTIIEKKAKVSKLQVAIAKILVINKSNGLKFFFKIMSLSRFLLL